MDVDPRPVKTYPGTMPIQAMSQQNEGNLFRKEWHQLASTSDVQDDGRHNLNTVQCSPLSLDAQVKGSNDRSRAINVDGVCDKEKKQTAGFQLNTGDVGQTSEAPTPDRIMKSEDIENNINVTGGRRIIQRRPPVHRNTSYEKSHALQVDDGARHNANMYQEMLPAESGKISLLAFIETFRLSTGIDYMQGINTIYPKQQQR